MNIFFTKERKQIIYACLGLFFILSIFGLTNILPVSERFKDLLINLSASVVTIAFTVVFVDYLNNRSFEKRMNSISESGIRKFDNLVYKLELEICAFTGYKHKESYKGKGHIETLEIIKKEINSHLKRLDAPGKSNSIIKKNTSHKKIENLLAKIDSLYKELISIIDTYSSSLPQDLYENSILLSDSIDRVQSTYGIYTAQSSKKDTFWISASLWALTQQLLTARTETDKNPKSKINKYKSTLRTNK